MGSTLFTHSIEDTGVVHRVYFAVGLGEPMNRDWHYFGITSADIPIPEATYNSYTEHNYVQFPTDFSSLSSEAYWDLYSLALNAGLNREGIT